MFTLPALGTDAIPLPHFPNVCYAFIFRAAEFFPIKKIAQILRTSEENVAKAVEEMGLNGITPSEQWLKKGTITVIRRLWHILPYSQLLELLEMTEEELARTLREEDFLDVKLQKKPVCPPVVWQELTEEQRKQAAQIRSIVEGLPLGGVDPFDFRYSVPEIRFSGEPVLESRIIYLFTGLYQHAFDVESEEYCSDALLEAYQRLGINGVWTQGILTQLAPFPFHPELSKDWKIRLERMGRFVQRLKKYGIRLYLYLNEPRSMPLSFFEAHPELKGHVQGANACLCTSNNDVKEYLTESVATICRNVPDIGGFITITRSENLTNCFSHSNNETCSCPRCRTRSIGEVIGETISCFAAGAHRVDPEIKVFAWSWAWSKRSEEIIRNLPKDVILISQSELDVPYEIGGVHGNVIDYSMSIIGPGDHAKQEWRLAKECGLEIGAKIQANTTWEGSTVPALPVSPLVRAHFEGLKQENIKHILLSWTLGGYPSVNLSHAAQYFYESCSVAPQSEAVQKAEEAFSLAFQAFPFDIRVLYRGPQNAGPSTLLFPGKTGYRATMTCFAYDDLDGWRGNYPVDVFEDQFSKLCSGWEKGLAILEAEPDDETKIMAEAAYCLFRSSLNQIRFIRARDAERWADAAVVAREEKAISLSMLQQMNRNAAIGFEAANHYYFSKLQLAEKLVNCDFVIELFENRV